MVTGGIDSIQTALGAAYILERELGRGGMATVYLARDTKHGRLVALKVLHPELAAVLGAERFRREITLAARLQHAHILSVHDSGVTTAGHLWFTMPYVDGETLRAKLRREKQLAIEDTLRITREIASALAHAHDHGVLHRDIKPENILLTSENDVLLADFGIARTFSATAGPGEPSLTETGIVIGTPQYMSPEQASGERDIDARSDIYALGAVCYEMLTGEPPFTGVTAQAVIAKMMSGQAPSARRVRPTLPEAVDAAVRKALARIPADRYATVRDFARALDGAERTTSGPAATLPQVGRAQRRVPMGAMLIGLGFVLGAGVLFAWRSHKRGVATTPMGARGIRLAVLPFDNLGDSTEAYFADGVTDAVRGKLSGLPGLQVIGSTSSNQYRKTNKTPQQIGEELGVRYLLLGRVRWAKTPGGPSRVQVSPELVDAGTAADKWAQAVDAPLTDVFRVQADIAGQVARELQVALTPAAQQTLADRPTADLTAYDTYLRGEEVLRGGNSPAVLHRAAVLFKEATGRDSTFAMAWADLASAQAVSYANGVPTAALADSADRNSAHAIALAPSLPEAHTARGAFYSFIRGDLERAVREDEMALTLAPWDARTLRRTALIEQSLGRWDAAVAHLKQATSLDPRDAKAAEVLGSAELRRRDYAAAERALDRSLALKPTNLAAIDQRMMVALAQGDLSTARAVLRAVPSSVDTTSLVAYLGEYFDLGWALDSSNARRLLDTRPDAFNGDRAAWASVLAQLYSVHGDARRTRAYADTARAAFEAQLLTAPDDPQRHVEFGLALAYLGRKQDAIREGELGTALLPASKDQYLGPYIQHLLVRIYVLTGEPDKALDALEPLLTMPYYLSPRWLTIDPAFAPLMQYPRFQRLIAGDRPVASRTFGWVHQRLTGSEFDTRA